MERSVFSRAARELICRVGEALYPVACAACGARLDGRAGGLPLCGACDAALVPLGEAFCLTCARTGGDPRRCVRASHLALAGAFVWNEPVRALVHALKFGDTPELAPALVARAWSTPAFAARPRPDALVPAALHALRRRERGYDQSEALAQAFAPLVGAPAGRWLRRRRATRQQARLGARERAANLAGAFEVIAPAMVRGRRVAVVDDVVTTGATGSAACEALVRAGAQRVELWAIAYEPLE